MGGKISLPLTVELAATAGPMDPSPTWTDISEHVQRAKTISLSRGNSPETWEPEPGRGQLRIRNKDGDFTPGTASAVLGGATVRNRMPIRVRRGSTVLWTGLVEKWAMGYDAGMLPVCDATLVDRWARLKARTLTGERIASVCQALDCADLWPLDEPAGSTRAVSLTSGWALKSLYGTAPRWGEAPDPHTGATGMLPVVHLPDEATLTGVWDGTGAASPGLYADGFTVSMWVRCPTAGAAADWFIGEHIEDDNGIVVHVYQSGLEIISEPLDTGTLYVGVTLSAGWRHVVATADFTGAAPVLTLWLDGVQVYTYTTLPSPWVPTRLHTLRGFDADLAYAATWPRVLTSAEIQAVTAAGSNAVGQTGQTGDVRAGLIAEMWAPTTITVQGTWTATMSKQTVEGVSQADLLLQCATAESGMVFIGRDGWPVLASKGHRSAASVVGLTVTGWDDPQPYDLPIPWDGGTTGATIPARVLASATQWELDDAQIVNVVQVDRMALDQTVTTVNRRNKDSIGMYGEVSKTWQVWLDSDTQAVERAETEAAMWVDPTCRSRSFTVDLATCQSAVSEAELLAVDIGSRIVISDLPDTAPDQTAAGWYVDAIADEITEASWRRTFTVSPAIDCLVLDDLTFGGLDEWPIG